MSEERKIMVNVGIPNDKLNWIDSDRGNVSRSEYLGAILLPVIDERIKAEQGGAQYVAVAN